MRFVVKVVSKGRIWTDLTGGASIHWVRQRVTSVQECEISSHKERWGNVLCWSHL